MTPRHQKAAGFPEALPCHATLNELIRNRLANGVCGWNERSDAIDVRHRRDRRRNRLIRGVEGGVGASIPSPEIGQISELDGLSVFTVPGARFGLHVGLFQSGLLSLSTPTFEPPTTSR
jgi:hypothetical protein